MKSCLIKDLFDYRELIKAAFKQELHHYDVIVIIIILFLWDPSCSISRNMYVDHKILLF